MGRLDLALAEARQLGWKPVPLAPKKKAPFTKKWQETDFPDSDFQDTFNIGASFGNNWADLDFDDHGAAQIARSLYAGYRMFQRCAERLHVVVKVESGEGIFLDLGVGEYRSGDHHQTMLPPSIHPDGQVCEWVNPDRDFFSYPNHDAAIAEFKAMNVASVFLKYWEKPYRDVLAMILPAICKRLNIPEDRAAQLQQIIYDIADDTSDPARGNKVKRVYAGEGRQYGMTKATEILSPEDAQKVRGILAQAADFGWREINVGDLVTSIQATDFPMAYFPPGVRDYLQDVALALQLPDGAPATLALGTLCLAAGNQRIEVGTGWTEPLCIWSQVIADQGYSKSALLAHMSGAIRDFEMILEKVFAIQSARWQQMDREEDVDPGPHPVRRFVVLDSATPEYVIHSMGEDQTGHGGILDELSGLHRDLSSSGGGKMASAKELFLTSWSGNAFNRGIKGERQDRAQGRNMVKLPQTYHAIVGTTTRTSLEQTIQQADHDNGFLVRFLSFVIPAGYTREKPPRFEIRPEHRDAFHQLQQALCALRLEGPSLRLDPLTKAMFLDYNDAMTERARQLGASDDPLAGYVAKYPRQAMRLAALHALLRTPTRKVRSFDVGDVLTGRLQLELENPWHVFDAAVITINQSDLAAAQGVLQASEQQILNLVTVTENSDLERSWKKIARWLNRKGQNTFTIGDLTHQIRPFGRATSNRPRDVENLISDLVNWGLCKRTDSLIGAQGVRAGAFCIHPQLLEAVGERTPEGD